MNDLVAKFGEKIAVLGFPSNQFGHQSNEGDAEFVSTLMTDSNLQIGLLMSGMSFYLYNELATMTIKKTGAVTSSVANTAKRVIVMVYMAALTGKALTEEQTIGASVAIGGVMIYSVIDDVLKDILIILRL